MNKITSANDLKKVLTSAKFPVWIIGRNVFGKITGIPIRKRELIDEGLRTLEADNAVWDSLQIRSR